MDAKRVKKTEFLLRIGATAIFAIVVLAGLQTSISVSAMQDVGYSLYHDPVDVYVIWLQSQACMVLPPDNYLANCTTIPSIGITFASMALLIAVIFTYFIVHKKLRSNPP